MFLQPRRWALPLDDAVQALPRDRTGAVGLVRVTTGAAFARRYQRLIAGIQQAPLTCGLIQALMTTKGGHRA